MTEKQCTRCLITKPLSEFRKDSRLKSGIGSQCKSCSSIRAREWAINNSEKYKSTNKLWRESNKAYDSARKMEWAKNNPDKKKAADAKSYRVNIERRRETYRLYRQKNLERLRAKSREYFKLNIHKKLAYNKYREQLKNQRTPAWLTKDDLLKIEAMYKLAKQKEAETGIKYHVDHIIPLNGVLVSGLHVPDNLQVITAEENLRKNNTYIP